MHHLRRPRMIDSRNMHRRHSTVLKRHKKLLTLSIWHNNRKNNITQSGFQLAPYLNGSHISKFEVPSLPSLFSLSRRAHPLNPARILGERRARPTNSFDAFFAFLGLRINEQFKNNSNDDDANNNKMTSM